MTTHEALSILALHAPLSRETLNHAYEALAQGCEGPEVQRLYEAYSHLFELPDHEFPYQEVATASGMIRQPQQQPHIISMAPEDPTLLEDGPAPLFHRIAAGVFDFIVISLISSATGLTAAYLKSIQPGAADTSSPRPCLKTCRLANRGH